MPRPAFQIDPNDLPDEANDLTNNIPSTNGPSATGPETDTDNSGQSTETESQSTTETAAASAPTDPNVAASQSRATRNATQNQEQQQGQEWQSIREAASRYGYTFDEGVTDDQALVQLVQAANNSRRADYFSQLGQQLAPYVTRPEVQQAIRSAAAPAAPAKSEWDKPEFDPRWRNLVELDEKTGVYLAKPGAPPEIARKVNDYASWYGRTQEDPEGYITHIVSRIIDQAFPQRIKEVQETQARQNATQRIIEQNAEWLYARGQDGNYLYDRTGRPTLSAAGGIYASHVRTLAQSGISDPVQQDAIARRMLAGDLAAAQDRKSTGQTQQQRPQTRAARTAANVNDAGTRSAVDQRTDPAAVRGKSRQSLRSQMMHAFDDAGVTDDDVATLLRS